MKKKKRQLSDEEKALWTRLKATVTPLTPYHSQSSFIEDAQQTPQKPLSEGERIIPSSLVENATPGNDQAPSKAIPLSNADGLMKKRRKDVKTGRIEPRAKLDLHGLRLEAAEGAFSQFIQSSAKNGYDVVLVVTGKGGYRRYDELGYEVSGVIRRALPIWVHKRENSSLISHYLPAHIHHGGEGAWYIFIRSKARRKYSKSPR